MSWYTDLVAVFTDDGGVWTVTSNWESARLFIDGVIQNSEIDETQRDKLTDFEIITYDEKKRDIQSYSKALYNYVSSNNYPQQVQIVFKSLTDSTAAVVNQADSLGDTSIVIPSWIKWGAGAYLLFLVLKR